MAEPSSPCRPRSTRAVARSGAAYVTSRSPIPIASVTSASASSILPAARRMRASPASVATRNPQTLHSRATSTAFSPSTIAWPCHPARVGFAPACSGTKSPRSGVDYRRRLRREGVRLLDALVPAPAPVRLQHELRAEMAEPIAKAEAPGIAPCPRMQLEAALQLARRLESSSEIGPGSDDFDRADRVCDLDCLLERLDSRLISPLCRPDCCQDDCAKVFRSETLSHRERFLRVLLPAWGADRSRTIGELREHECLRARKRAFPHKLEACCKRASELSVPILPPPERGHCLGLGSLLPVPLPHELVAGLLELCGRRFCPIACDAEAEEHVCPLRVVARPEIEGASIEARGRRERVQRERAVAGAAKRVPRALLERRIDRADGSAIVDRPEIMMGKDLRVVLGSPQRGHPLGDGAMLRKPRRPRDLTVGDVRDQQVQEGVLALAFDRRPALTANELLPVRAWSICSTPDRSRPFIR